MAGQGQNAAMANVTLRLTEQQHAELVKAAHAAQRSLQREIIWRLFTKQGTSLRAAPQER